MENSNKVYLYVYDLTNGMAKTLAPMLIGRSIEGIWHTGIVVFGNEYFFGDGICNMSPGTTPFGSPYKKEYLGETEIDKDLFHEFLSDIKDRFSPIKYNVKSHNCNHFTNECANFLVGANIPHDILNQATDLFNTSLGKMIEPMVMQQQDALKQGSNNMFGSSADSVASGMGGLSLGSGASKTDKKLFEVKSLTEIQDLIQAYPGLVIDCWSPTCPPCMKFKPIFHDMSEQYGSSKVKFVTVNTKEAPEVAMNFMVTSIPAFFIYQNGECISQFVGANKPKLEGLVKQLKTNVGDDGKSTSTSSAPEVPAVIRLKYDLGFIQFKPVSNQAILFESITNMSKIGAKVKDIIASVDNDDIKELKDLMDDFKMPNFTPDILSQLFTLAQRCKEDDIFAVFDFLRCSFITEKLATSATGYNWELLDKSLSRIETLCECDPADIPKNIANAQMTSTQAVCNLFKFKNSSSAIIEEPEKAIRLLMFAGRMLNSIKDKSISGAATVALNVMIKFDEIEVAKIESDNSTSWEDKIKLLGERFEIINEGSRFYCEEATKSYPKIDNGDALFKLIMSECRVLHSNFKLIEHFAGDDDFLKNRMRVTQKYPSGQLNDLYCSLINKI